jgi:outer membrane protein
MSKFRTVDSLSRFKVFFISIAAIIMLSSGANGQKVWSLEDCINYALDNNILVKQSELATEGYDINLLESKLSIIPSLNASTSYSWSEGRTPDPQTNIYTTQNSRQQFYQINSQMTLFNGLQQYNNIKKAKFDLLASQYDADAMKDDISLLIAAGYLQILFSIELVKTAQDQVDITAQQISRTQKLVDAGTLAKGDLLEIQSQGAREEVNLINAENQLNLAYLDLLQLLDMSASERFDIQQPNIIIEQAKLELIPSDKVYEYAVINRPEIKGAEYRLESANKALAIAKGSRSPIVTLGGSWNTSWSDQIRNDFLDPESGTMEYWKQVRDNNPNKGWSISLSIPIFNGFQVSSYINRSKLATLNAEYDLELTQNEIRKTVETAYTDAIASFKTYQANVKSLESFRESFKYMEQKFNVGLVNSLDYNIAKQQLTRAESDLISAKFDFVFKTKVLDFYMGRPITLDEFDVQN